VEGVDPKKRDIASFDELQIHHEVFGKMRSIEREVI
jgi:hypothetical protein